MNVTENPPARLATQEINGTLVISLSKQDVQPENLAATREQLLEAAATRRKAVIGQKDSKVVLDMTALDYDHIASRQIAKPRLVQDEAGRQYWDARRDPDSKELTFSTVLLEFNSSLKKHGHALVVAAGQDIRGMIDQTGLRLLFSHAPSVEEATSPSPGTPRRAG